MAQVNNNTIVVVNAVGPIVVEPWIDNPNGTQIPLLTSAQFAFELIHDVFSHCTSETIDRPLNNAKDDCSMRIRRYGAVCLVKKPVMLSSTCSTARTIQGLFAIRFYSNRQLRNASADDFLTLSERASAIMPLKSIRISLLELWRFPTPKGFSLTIVTLMQYVNSLY